eukprot:4216-Heterococcus_DN1.PRE.2
MRSLGACRWRCYSCVAMGAAMSQFRWFCQVLARQQQAETAAPKDQPERRSRLTNAVLQRDKKLVAQLLQQGADPTAFDYGAATSLLLLAAIRSDRAIVKILLSEQTDIQRLYMRWQMRAASDPTTDAYATHQLLTAAACEILPLLKGQHQQDCTSATSGPLQDLVALRAELTADECQTSLFALCAMVRQLPVTEPVGLKENKLSDGFTAFTAGSARCTPHTWLVIDSTLQSTVACTYYNAAITRAELSARQPAAVWLWAVGMACFLCSRRVRNCRLSDLPSAAVPPPQHSGSKRTAIMLMTALLLLLEVWALQHYLLRWLPDHIYSQSNDAAVQCSRGKQWVRWAVAAYSVCVLLYNGVPQLAIAACRCGIRLRPASQVLQSLDKWLMSPFGGESQLVYVELYRGAAISSTAEQLMELYSWLQSPHGVLTNAVTAAAAAKDYTAVRAILQVFELGDTRQRDIADATGANLSNKAKQQLQQRGVTAGTGTASRVAVWVQQRMLECLDMHDPTRSGFSSASAELLLTALSACLVASSGQYSQHAREAYMHSCTTTYKSGYKLIPNKAHLDEIHALVSGSSSADAAITALVSANSAVVSTATSSSS